MKCKICGKEITAFGRRSYCSEECAKEGNRRNARGYEGEPDWHKPVKCKMCGKEFTRISGKQMFCHWKCQKKYQAQERFIKERIEKIANKRDFEVKNKDKIIRAKLMLFKNDDVTRCPCDASNPNRYCGSALCIADTIYKGHCHCSLFFAKKTLQDYENGL